MGVRNRVGIWLSYRPARLHSLCGIGFLESILGHLKSLKILALAIRYDNPIPTRFLARMKTTNKYQAYSKRSTTIHIKTTQCALFVYLFIFLFVRSYLIGARCWVTKTNTQPSWDKKEKVNVNLVLM
jgi:hypothetical protein